MASLSWYLSSPLLDLFISFAFPFLLTRHPGNDKSVRTRTATDCFDAKGQLTKLLQYSLLLWHRSFGISQKKKNWRLPTPLYIYIIFVLADLESQRDVDGHAHIRPLIPSPPLPRKKIERKAEKRRSADQTSSGGSWTLLVLSVVLLTLALLRTTLNECVRVRVQRRRREDFFFFSFFCHS